MERAMETSDKPCIVCIDDEEGVRETLQKILDREYGEQYKVFTAEDGRSGIELVDFLIERGESVACVLCDQRMPGIDGIETLAIIKEKHPYIPRAMFTAYGNEVELVKRAISEAHVDEFIDKPVEPPSEKLFPFVNRMLAQYELNLQRDVVYSYELEKTKAAVKIETRPISFGELWAFYIKSNFIYTSKHQALQPYMNEINETWRNLLAAGPELGRTILRFRNDIPRNSLSIVRCFPRTWLVQHMVSNKDPLGMVAVLLDSVEWMMGKPEIHFAKFYWRPNNPTPNALFGSMAELLAEKAESSYNYESLDYYILPVKKCAMGHSSRNTVSHIEVIEVNHHFLERICDCLKQVRPNLIIEADGLSHEEITLGELSALFMKYGLFRERNVFAALCKDRVRAVALAECSSLGLNLSYYFNKLEIYLTDDETPEVSDKSVVEATLKIVSEWYAGKGRDFIVLLSGDRTSSALEELGFLPTKRYLGMTVARDAFRDGYAHMEKFYKDRVSRLLRRRKTF